MVGAIKNFQHLSSVCKQYKSCSECPLSAQGKPAIYALCPRVKPNPWTWGNEDIAQMVKAIETEYRKIGE